LAGADDDVVDIEHSVPAVDADVQAGLVDAVIPHAGQLVHTAVAQRRPMHPTGRLTQSGADLGALALQQIHLPRRCWRLRSGQPAGVFGRVGHAPLAQPVCDGLRPYPAMRQQRGDVDTAAAGADHRDPPADVDLPGDHLGVAVHVRPVDSRDVRNTRCHTGGQHDVVVAGVEQLGRGDTVVEVQFDTGDLQSAGEIADGFGEFLLAGD